MPHRKRREAELLIWKLNLLEIREPHLRPVCQRPRDLMAQGRRDSSSAVLLIRYIVESLPAEEAHALARAAPGALAERRHRYHVGRLCALRSQIIGPSIAVATGMAATRPAVSHVGFAGPQKARRKQVCTERVARSVLRRETPIVSRPATRQDRTAAARCRIASSKMLPSEARCLT